MSWRTRRQSAEPGSISPRRRLPANVPSETLSRMRRPREPSPVSSELPTPALRVKRWASGGPVSTDGLKVIAISSILVLSSYSVSNHPNSRRACQAMQPTRFDFDLANCGIQRALDVLGEKWTLLVLREAI